MNKTTLAVLSAALLGGLAFTSPSVAADRSPKDSTTASTGKRSAQQTTLSKQRQIFPTLQSLAAQKRAVPDSGQPTNGVGSSRSKADTARHVQSRKAGNAVIATLADRACASQSDAAGRQVLRSGKFESSCEGVAVKQKPVRVIIPR